MTKRMNPVSTASIEVNAASADAALPRGLRLGAFEIERVIARSSTTVVYLATDHGLALKVAIQEFLPSRFARRDAGLQLRAAEAWHEDAMARGLRAFVEESRLLARCEHPGLVRVNQLFEGLGSAYRVMPLYNGQRLSDLRREMSRPPDEATLRRLLDTLLGAAEALHRAGHSHGKITPTNILLLADDRPILLSPGAAGNEVGNDLVDSLMATLEAGSATGRTADPATGAPTTGVAGDLYAIAQTGRFCVTGETPASAGTEGTREPLAVVLAREYPHEARPHYSAALLDTLDAALSALTGDRPLTTAQFCDWLERGVPGRPVRLTLPRTPAFHSDPDFASATAATTASTIAAIAAPAATLAAAPPFASACASTPTDAAASSRTSAESPPPAPATALRRPTPSAATQTSPRAADSGLRGTERSPDLIDPSVPERPPSIAPPLPPRLARPASTRARNHKALLVVSLTVSAAAVLAVATGWWNLSPEIQVEPFAQRTDLPTVASQQPTPEPPPTASARVEPAGTVAPPLPAPATEAVTASSIERNVAAALPSARAIDSPPPSSGPVDSVASAVPPERSAELDRQLSAQRPGAGAGAGAGVGVGVGVGADSSARPVRSGPAESTGPRGACLGRTEFALYRCMQQQCQTRRWGAHPQCVKLRRDDQVD